MTKKHDGGIELTSSKIEKLSLQDLYPRRPPRNGTPTEEMGVVGPTMSTSMDLDIVRENYRCRTSTHRTSAIGG